MMGDIEKVKRNVGRMIDQGAPESDIDAYIAGEGVTVAQLRNGGERQAMSGLRILESAGTMAADVPKALGSGVVRGVTEIAGFGGNVATAANASLTDPQRQEALSAM